MTPNQGCAHRCLDPDCNEATFDRTATACAHCQGTRLRAEHPGGIFDPERQAFICSHCGGEDLDPLLLLRHQFRAGRLAEKVPEMAQLLDLTDH